MRKIKFRGIGQDRKWYYGDLRHNGSSLRIEWEETDWKAMPPLGTIVKKGVNVKKETVGQYTGLKDKNGKEIYEGDVLKVPDLYETPEYTYPTYHYEKVVYENYGFGTNAAMFYEDGDYISEECEVVGNIYDNPELMGSEVS